MTGEFYLHMSGLGADCEGYRPFEAEFLEPLSEEDYAKREKKMQEKLEAVRETLEEYRGSLTITWKRPTAARRLAEGPKRRTANEPARIDNRAELFSREKFLISPLYDDNGSRSP